AAGEKANDSAAIAARIESVLGSRMETFRGEALSEIKAANQTIQSIKMKHIDTSEAEEKLQEALNEFNLKLYPDAARLAEEAKALAENKLEEEKNASSEEISEAEKAVNSTERSIQTLKSAGIPLEKAESELNSAKTKLEDAKNYFQNGYYTDAKL
ncbi:hypothetical protein, partial [Thermococcus sp. GR7]